MDADVHLVRPVRLAIPPLLPTVEPVRQVLGQAPGTGGDDGLPLIPVRDQVFSFWRATSYDVLVRLTCSYAVLVRTPCSYATVLVRPEGLEP